MPRDSLGRFSSGGVSGNVTGVERVVVNLTSVYPALVRSNVQKEVALLGFTLERKVKLEKLMGQVLKRQTGRGSQSINTKLSSPGPNIFSASVGTNVWYMRMWERFGHRAYDIVPSAKKALFWKGADHPVGRVHIPKANPKPFLRPTLEEMRPTILLRLQAAAKII
jgi:hypothetical protein